jgi:putative N6-adenine-specific DNA methylase
MEAEGRKPSPLTPLPEAEGKKPSPLTPLPQGQGKKPAPRTSFSERKGKKPSRPAPLPQGQGNKHSRPAPLPEGPEKNAAPSDFFAVCPRGLQELLAYELQACGARSVRPAPGGAGFDGTLATAYAANLHSRLASRVLWRLTGGAYRNETDLYEMALALAWEDHFRPSQTLRVDVTATRSPLRSLQFATLKIKDAIADRMRERCGERPSVDRSTPDVQVLAHLTDQRADLYLDLSGEALFKRGWRLDKGEAPLKENLAAGLLACSGWSPDTPLHDPFCGSGTIAIEAACIASRRAPGLGRRFAFEKLLGFDARAWRDLLGQARQAVDERARFLISGSDISTRVIETALANARRAGLAHAMGAGSLRFHAADARTAPAPSFTPGSTTEGKPALAPGTTTEGLPSFAPGAPAPGAKEGLIVTNPPYGQQSEPKSATVARLMDRFGDQLKHAYPGWDAWLLSGDRDLPAQLKLKETRRTVLFNGPIECRFYRFELVAGSYRRTRLSNLSPTAS